MADVFISYATEDRQRVKPIVEAIEHAGFSVWWDRRISLGSSFDREIERELDSARCVLVVWSSDSIESDWVRNEAQEGLDRGVLVPLLIDDVKPPLAFRRTQTAVLSSNPTNEELDPVLTAVDVCLRRGSETSPSDLEEPPTGREKIRRSRKAIAVLPFQNLSNDPEQEFFSDGIAEDILNELAKGAELMVRPRSSSFSLKGESLDVPTIGTRLNVTHVLDGSVRRSGGRVRVTAQLSEVETNRSIWSERYDRELTDVFEVQDEITSEVLQALKAQLGVTRSPRHFVGTEAYNAFLRGRHHLAQGEGKLALEWYETATRLGPQNADALAGLGRMQDMRGPHRGQSLGEHRIQMAAHFDRVLAIDPAHPQTLAWKAENTFFKDRDYQSSINQLVALVNANPSHEEAHRSLSWVLQAIGREELYLQTSRRMVEISPLSREAMLNEINAYINTGHISEARLAIDELSRLEIREDPLSTAWLAILDRDPDALQAVVSRNATDAWNFPFRRVWNMAMIPYLKGEFEQAQEITAARKRGGRAPSTLEKHMIALIERDFDAALDHYADALEAGLWFAFVRAQLNYPLQQTFPELYEDLRYGHLLQNYKLDPASTAALKVPELVFSV